MSSTQPTAHTHALKRSVTRTADDENKGTFPLKRQASGEQRSILLIKTFTPSSSSWYPEDSSDDEADKLRRRNTLAASNKRREELEARNDDDAIRLFSRPVKSQQDDVSVLFLPVNGGVFLPLRGMRAAAAGVVVAMNGGENKLEHK